MIKGRIIVLYHFDTSFEICVDVHVFRNLHLVGVIATDEEMSLQFQGVHVTVFD